jgi:hypothetical protein
MQSAVNERCFHGGNLSVMSGGVINEWLYAEGKWSKAE